MRNYNVEGIVLKSTNYKDSDRIYTLFTKDKGKISVMAKGVRKISSRRSGNLDTLNYISAGIFESSKGFKSLTEVKSIKSFRNVKKTLKNSVNGYYVLELIHRFLEEEQENNKIFELLLSTLKKLDSINEEFIRTINEFEISLMGLLGYEMRVDRCVICDKKYSSDWSSVKFNMAFGGLVCDTCNGNGILISKDLAETLVSLKSKTNISAISFENAVEADELVKTYVKEILEDGIRTQRVFNI